ncbi:MAG: phosphopantothenoylcysteine decarboxylase, partial [Oscillospiraceae bacterium]|nr:phosphopantothenoylcysteine decarboxylase [Oscillospiraceae bacterium]
RVDGQFLCGFSMETQNMLENSRQKLIKKNIDMIAANNLRQQGAGFGVDTNVLTLITADSEKELPMLSKDDAANELLTEILQKMKK